MDNFVDNVDNFYSVEVVIASICGIWLKLYTQYIELYTQYIELYTQYIDALYDAFRYFIKFVHFVLEISATTISCVSTYPHSLSGICLYLTHLGMENNG